MMPHRSTCVRSDHPDGTPPASARHVPGRTGTRPTDPARSACDLVKICMTTPKRGGMQPSPIDWLERDYDQPGVFRAPVFEEIHTPFGPFQVKPDHPHDCRCEIGEGEFWTQTPAVMKWRAS